MEKTTLCYVEKNDCYLMLHRVKREKDLNKGKWIGIGGHMNNSETPEECIIREAKEETGLILNSVCLQGKLFFQNNDFKEEISLFTTEDFSGDLIECDEGDLAWINKKDIFDLNLWEADPIFLRKLIQNEPYFELDLIYENGKLIRSVEK